MPPPPFGDEEPAELDPPPLGLAPELEPEPAVEPDPAAPAPDLGWSGVESPARSARRARRRRPAAFSSRQDAARDPSGVREPRHVHAVPTSVEHKIDAAIELFNGSEHPRTVAGITRSLGLPDVAAYPTSPVGAIVNLVLSWELCWYRYEVDLSEEVPVVRGAGQGYELSELTELERQANVVADERGMLTAATE
ncbi:hypothetical protein [Baekduia sp.]|uniref:hypothetical protein n=1 Tax=Baekduia sp. TaxID=2600305 RepID=UPI002D76BB81|nr:hypothetical protein [Baekduia sp.]